MTPRQQIAAALRDGHRAALDGDARTTCPYRLGTEDQLEDLLATLWLRAFDRVSPMPVEFEGEGSGT